MPMTEKQLRVLRANNEETHRDAVACIKHALVYLLQQKRYDDIRMTDIIRKSGISRAGVYKNYKSKAEIMLEIYEEPIRDVISSLTDSVFDNLDLIFRTGKKHEEAIRSILDAGLEHHLLEIMNRQYSDVSSSFYMPLWIGMIYNAFIEWAKKGMDEPVETAVERVSADLKKVAESIKTGLTNSTQNRRKEASACSSTHS